MPEAQSSHTGFTRLLAILYTVEKDRYDPFQRGRSAVLRGKRYV